MRASSEPANKGIAIPAPKPRQGYRSHRLARVASAGSHPRPPVHLRPLALQLAEIRSLRAACLVCLKVFSMRITKGGGRICSGQNYAENARTACPKVHFFAVTLSQFGNSFPPSGLLAQHPPRYLLHYLGADHGRPPALVAPRVVLHHVRPCQSPAQRLQKIEHLSHR